MMRALAATNGLGSGKICPTVKKFPSLEPEAVSDRPRRTLSWRRLCTRRAPMPASRTTLAVISTARMAVDAHVRIERSR